MSNYKWLTSSKPGKTIDPHCISLCNAEFSELEFPFVKASSIDRLLRAELIKNGIDCCSVGSFYILNPINLRYISITAPLYCAVDGNCEKIAESYTNEALDPMQYQWVLETFEHCKEVVRQKQKEKFYELFHENSLDGGLTAVIEITNGHCVVPDTLLKKYIPSTFLTVCSNISYSSNSSTTVLFMKKMDAKGGVVTIKVPDNMKGLTIGKGGENIKRVARMINARRINVV